MKTRPPGATAIAVAAVRPTTTFVSSNPGGSFTGPMIPLPGVGLIGVAEALEVRDQVGELGSAQSARQALGHDRGLGELAGRDVPPGDDCLSNLIVDQSQALGGLGLDKADQHATIVEGEDRHRAVSLHDLPRGLENGLDQVLAGVLVPDVREIGPDLAPAPHAVAADAAGTLLVLEDRAAPGGVASVGQGMASIRFLRSSVGRD